MINRASDSLKRLKAFEPALVLFQQNSKCLFHHYVRAWVSSLCDFALQLLDCIWRQVDVHTEFLPLVYSARSSVRLNCSANGQTGQSSRNGFEQLLHWLRGLKPLQLDSISPHMRQFIVRLSLQPTFGAVSKNRLQYGFRPAPGAVQR